MDTQPQKQLKVLLIGETCIDQYYIGSVERLSPEAPVPVLNVISSYTLEGMASNVCKNLQKLGVFVDFISNEDIITKTRYIDDRSKQHLLRVDSEKNIKLWDGLLHRKDLRFYDAIVISDYNKGFLNYELIEDLIHKFNGRVFIDTKKKDLKRFSGATAVKINETEFNVASTLSKNIIVTLGKSGAQYYGKNYPVKSTEVVDVCGCGDTFLAALTYSFLTTNSMNEAIRFANDAASITVGHRGNYAPSLQEIKARSYNG